MERRAFIAIAISFVVLLGWTYLFPPPQRQQAPAPLPAAAQPEDPRERPPALAEPADPDSTAELGDPPGISADSLEEFEVSNDYFTVVWSNRGGRALSWRLTSGEYTTRDGEPLELLPRYPDADMLQLGIDLDDRALADEVNQALFRVERTSVSRRGDTGPGEKITFTWSDGRGVEARKAFTIWRESWLVDVDVEVVDRGRRRPTRLIVGPGFGAQESDTGRVRYYYTGQGVWNQGGQITHRRPKGLTKEEGGISGGVQWAGLEDQYFAAIVLPGESEAVVRWRSDEVTLLPTPWDEEGKEPESARQAILSVSVGRGAQLYVGPKKYTLMREMGHELERAVWFSSYGLLAAIAKFIFLALVWIHDHIFGNYGVAIILATFVLRVMLFPLNQYAMVQMKKAQLQGQKLQPKIKSIRAKHSKKKDAQTRAKMQQEIMDLYKREGVNPMGGITGCLPMLAQFPILIGFYNMLTVVVELRGAPSVLWIQDLSVKDPFWIIPILMGVTMFVQQKLSMSKVTDPMVQQQQKFMMFMPFFFTWICLQMPSGMVLYWFVNNLLGIGQQHLVNKKTSKLAEA